MSEIVTQGSDETITCQFCKRPTPGDFNFCVECDNQIKCLNCGRKTFPGKNYCLACAQPLIERPSLNQAPNQYERNVKRDGEKYEEHTRFALSDNAVHEIAPFIINQTMPDSANLNNVPRVLQSGENAPEDTIDTTYEDTNPKKQNSGEVNNNSNSQKDEATNAASHNSALVASDLGKFFERDGDNIITRENDFKGQNWAEQQRNFVILYTQAHKDLLGSYVLNKEAYKAPASKLNLVDPNNFTTHVGKQMSAFMSERSDGYSLNAAGEKELNRILALMNEDSKKGYEYWLNPTRAPKQQTTVSKEEKEKVARWVAESGDINLGSLDIRDVSAARDYALLAFWIIIHHLQKANAVKWNEALLFLTSKYDNTTITGNAFSKALNTKEAEKYFAKNGEGLTYLTTAGQQIVDELVAGIRKLKKDLFN